MRQSIQDQTRRLACLSYYCARSEEEALLLLVNEEQWLACQEMKPSIRKLGLKNSRGTSFIG